MRERIYHVFSRMIEVVSPTVRVVRQRLDVGASLRPGARCGQAARDSVHFAEMWEILTI